MKPRFLLARVLVGVLLAGTGGFGIARYAAFETTAIHEVGHVVDVRTESRSGGRRGGRFTIARPVVSFKLPASSDTTTAVAHVASSGGEFVRGQDVGIEFDPHDASGTLRVDTGMPMPDVATAAAGCFLLVNAAYAQIGAVRARRALALDKPAAADAHAAT
jgi:hypothetical protein